MKIKESILSHLKEKVIEKCKSLELNIEEITTSRNSEDKSSAGDKHETGRAMIEIELFNLKSQLAKSELLQNELNKIVLDRKTNEIGFGNLVETNQGSYFLAIGIGRVKIEEGEFYAISQDSPIGQLILGKKKGDIFNFNNRSIEILEVS